MSGRTWQLAAGGRVSTSRQRKNIALGDPRLSVLDLGIYLVLSEHHPMVYTPGELAVRGYGAVHVSAIEQSLMHLTALDYVESYK